MIDIESTVHGSGGTVLGTTSLSSTKCLIQNVRKRKTISLKPTRAIVNCEWNCELFNTYV